MWRWPLLIGATLLLIARKRPSCPEEGLQLRDLTPLLHDSATFRRIFGPRTIFFVETSGRAVLSPRQVCTLESFARLNPEFNLLMVFLKPAVRFREQENEALAAVLPHHTNIHLTTIDAKTAMDTSGFPEMHHLVSQSGDYLRHLSNCVRLVLIWRFGGAYLDLDVISFKSLSPELLQNPNLVAPMNSERLNNAFLQFRQGHPLVEGFIKRLRVTYNVSQRSEASRSLEQVLLNASGLSAVHQLITQGHVRDVVLPDFRLISSAHPRDFGLFFHPTRGHELLPQIAASKAIHLYSYKSHGMLTPLESSSIIANLSRRVCPRAFWSCSNFFY
ncbi:lactosylceramide 4-alpha-galactosyltransferase-like [Neocloeon triangulifer]|uniref:lactosylceramide 4-alpha-galactosyltransferase-like n=1 Tax=Neocloeon triangulifer TaxID=2078957 RepID=UPI00286EEE66|nr:lactosylceramide 4-alpha-galactosyltransferase-like [Neocloeon triangulifer]